MKAMKHPLAWTTTPVSKGAVANGTRGFPDGVGVRCQWITLGQPLQRCDHQLVPTLAMPMARIRLARSQPPCCLRSSASARGMTGAPVLFTLHTNPLAVPRWTAPSLADSWVRRRQLTTESFKFPRRVHDRHSACDAVRTATSGGATGN